MYHSSSSLQQTAECILLWMLLRWQRQRQQHHSVYYICFVSEYTDIGRTCVTCNWSPISCDFYYCWLEKTGICSLPAPSNVWGFFHFFLLIIITNINKLIALRTMWKCTNFMFFSTKIHAKCLCYIASWMWERTCCQTHQADRPLWTKISWIKTLLRW